MEDREERSALTRQDSNAARCPLAPTSSQGLCPQHREAAPSPPPFRKGPLLGFQVEGNCRRSQPRPCARVGGVLPLPPCPPIPPALQSSQPGVRRHGTGTTQHGAPSASGNSGRQQCRGARGSPGELCAQGGADAARSQGAVLRKLLRGGGRGAGSEATGQLQAGKGESRRQKGQMMPRWGPRAPEWAAPAAGCDQWRWLLAGGQRPHPPVWLPPLSSNWSPKARHLEGLSHRQLGHMPNMPPPPRSTLCPEMATEGPEGGRELPHPPVRNRWQTHTEPSLRAGPSSLTPWGPRLPSRGLTHLGSRSRREQRVSQSSPRTQPVPPAGSEHPTPACLD